MTLDDDLRAIEALNQHDVKAVLAGDTHAIASQWTDDFVVLSSGPTLRGREAHVLMLERGAEQAKAFVSLDYTVAFEEITVLGDYAYEWGTFRGSMRPRAGGRRSRTRQAAPHPSASARRSVEDAPDDDDERLGLELRTENVASTPACSDADRVLLRRHPWRPVFVARSDPRARSPHEPGGPS